MQEGLREKLLELIKSSGVLTSAERQQWREMLPLMNDKQGSELQGILTKPASSVPASLMSKPLSRPQPPQQSQPRPPAQSHFRPPELHHITNLPSGLNFNPRVKSPVPPLQKIKPVASPWKKTLQQRVTEKELSAPEEELDLPAPQLHAVPPTVPRAAAPTVPIEPVHPTQSVQNLFAPPAAPVSPPKPIPVKPLAPLPPPPPPTPAPKPVPPPPTPEAPPAAVMPEESSHAAVHVTTLADMSAMSISTFQLLGKEGLLDAIALLARKHGYFPAILAIEESPLYKMYLESGKTLLGPASAVQDGDGHILEKRVLSKEEFEAMNDILQKIQHS